MSKIKRVLVFLLCFALVLTTYTKFDFGSSITAKANSETVLKELSNVNTAKGESFSDDDYVNIIVSLKSDDVKPEALKTVEGIKERQGKTAQERQRGFAEIDKLGIKYETLCEYDVLLSGFALKVTYLDAKKIQALDIVDSVEVSVSYDKPEITISEPDNSNNIQPTNSGQTGGKRRGKRDLSSNEVINLNPLLKENKLGQGMVVSVIDSGLDVTHDVLRISNMETAKYKSKADMDKRIAEVSLSNSEGGWISDKVVYGYNYNDQDKNLKEANKESHGMHVSGISVGNPSKNSPVGELVPGVAPEAQLIFMRVFSDKERGTQGFIYTKALEDSVKLGADSINMSLGSATGTVKGVGKGVTNAIALARKSGCIVAIAGGNDGQFGEGYGNPLATNPDYGLVGNPSVSVDSLSVAALQNSQLRKPVLTVPELSGEQMFNNGKLAMSEPINTFKQNEDYSFVYCKLGKPEDLKDVDLTGKLALVERGEISFGDKLKNVVDKGAVGMVVFNHAEGGEETLGMNLGDVVKEEKYSKIPVTSLGHSDGAKLAENQDFHIKFTGEMSVFPNPDNGKLASFSSWGISNDGYLKPDITAPGANIYSSINEGEYTNMSGTSMAAPHVAGAVAVVKQVVKERFPNATDEELYLLVKSFLMSTARVNIDVDNGVESSPRQQGAGIIDTYKAAKSELYVTGDNNYPSVNAGNVGDQFSLNVVIHNVSDKPKVLKGSFVVNTDEVEDGRFALKPKNLLKQELGEVITVPANSTVTVPVKVDVSQFSSELSQLMPNGFFVEGFVKFRDAVDNINLVNIPYVGFRGDFANLPAIEKPIYDFEGEEKPFYYYVQPGNPASGVEEGMNFTTLITLENDKDIFKRSGVKILGEYCKDGRVGGELYLDKNKLAFNPKSATQHKSIIALTATALRNYSRGELNIYKEGDRSNPVYTSVGASSIKNFFGTKYPKSTLIDASAWDGKTNDGKVVDDGTYDYVFSYYPDFPGAKQQSLEFKLIVDSKVPATKGGTFDETTRKFKVFGYDETGSGLYRVYLDNKGKEIPLNDDGTYTIPNGVKLEDCELLMTDFAGNTDSVFLNNANLKGNNGIVAVSVLLEGKEEVKSFTRFKIYEIDNQGNEKEVKGEPFQFSSLPPEFAALFGLPEAKQYIKLPFGKYKVKILLNDEQIGLEEKEKTFELSQENSAVDVVFKAKFIASYDVNLKLVNETGEDKMPEDIKIYAVSKDDANAQEFSVPQGAMDKTLYSWDFNSGKYAIRVVVPEGYEAVPANFDLQVDKEEINKDIVIKKVSNNTDNSPSNKGWVFKDGNWYYFRDNGAMEKGWFQDGSIWYFLQEEDGKMVTGWKWIKDGWYYFRESGAMEKDWFQDGSIWYFLQDSGKMVTGWKWIKDAWYYFRDNGAMEKGWFLYDGSWYYLGNDGAMVAGTSIYYKGQIYYFDSSGRMK